MLTLATTARADNIIVVKPGSKVSSLGVFVPANIFRDMSTDLKELDLTKKQLEDCTVQKDQTHFSWDSFLWGTFVGVLGIVAIEHSTGGH